MALKVSKYVDMNNPKFKDKSELELWRMLNNEPELQNWIVANELQETMNSAIMSLGLTVGKAVIAVMSAKDSSTPST
jgi:ABC-type glycerol-3-phosphate transport system permease component